MGWARGFLVAAALAAAGCGFDSRSDDFTCQNVNDCPDDRTCVDGWCVREAGGDDGGGGDPVRCVADQPCVVSCSTPDSCPDGVDCTGATSCEVHCTGPGSCDGPITCSTGRCTIDCSGQGSCSSQIDCDAACACAVECGSGACGGSVDCPYPAPCKSGKECDDTPADTCDRC
jgi:hypothetical protein